MIFWQLFTSSLYQCTLSVYVHKTNYNVHKLHYKIVGIVRRTVDSVEAGEQLQNNKDILDGDSVKNIHNDTIGTVIANIKIEEPQGDVKIKNIVIDDNNNVIIIDKDNCSSYEKIVDR